MCCPWCGGRSLYIVLLPVVRPFPHGLTILFGRTCKVVLPSVHSATSPWPTLLMLTCAFTCRQFLIRLIVNRKKLHRLLRAILIIIRPLVTPSCSSVSLAVDA